VGKALEYNPSACCSNDARAFRRRPSPNSLARAAVRACLPAVGFFIVIRPTPSFMFRFIARRLLETIPVMLVIVTVTFFMQRLRARRSVSTAEKAITPEIKRNLEAYYHLNDPLWKQYRDYLWTSARKNSTGRPLGQLDPQGRPSASISALVQIPNRTVNEIIATSCRFRSNSAPRRWGSRCCSACRSGSRRREAQHLIDYPVLRHRDGRHLWPTFVLGPLRCCFAIHFGLVSTALGWYGPIDRELPALTLVSSTPPMSPGLTRGGMLEVLHQDLHSHRRAKARAKPGSSSGTLCARAAAGRLVPRPRAGAFSSGLVDIESDLPSPASAEDETTGSSPPRNAVPEDDPGFARALRPGGANVSWCNTSSMPPRVSRAT